MFAILNESVYIVGIVSEKKTVYAFQVWVFSNNQWSRTIDNIVANQLKNS